MLTATERDALIEEYADGPRRLRAALAAVPAGALRWRPAPGEWSVHEVIVHCGDSETISAGRIRYLLAEEDVRIAGYDEAHWAVAFDYHALPLEPSLAAIDAVRATTTLLIRAQGEAAWARAGTHSQSGRYGAEDWLRIYAEHLGLHVRQIEANVAAWHAAQGTAAAAGG